MIASDAHSQILFYLLKKLYVTSSDVEKVWTVWSVQQTRTG